MDLMSLEKGYLMSRRYFLSASILFLFLLFITGTGWSEKGGDFMSLTISSKSFRKTEDIPRKYTCDGSDISPQLSWNGVPEGTRSFAIIMDDPDAPMGTFNHWVLYDIPPEVRELPEGVPKDPVIPNGAKQGINSFRRVGYGGPCPPRGPAHRYYFYLYALDIPSLGLGTKATKVEVEKAMKGHILGQAEIMGRYGR